MLRHSTILLVVLRVYVAVVVVFAWLYERDLIKIRAQHKLTFIHSMCIRNKRTTMATGIL